MANEVVAIAGASLGVVQESVKTCISRGLHDETVLRSTALTPARCLTRCNVEDEHARERMAMQESPQQLGPKMLSGVQMVFHALAGLTFRGSTHDIANSGRIPIT